MFEGHIATLGLTDIGLANNSELVISKALLAAATRKSDELAELQARLESQRSGIFFFRLEIKAALERATKEAKAEDPHTFKMRKSEDTAAKGIESANKVILQATAVIIASERVISAVTALLDEASQEMKECRVRSNAEIEERHIVAEGLSKLSTDVIGLIQSIQSMSREITIMEEANQKDNIGEGLLREARRVLGFR